MFLTVAQHRQAAILIVAILAAGVVVLSLAQARRNGTQQTRPRRVGTTSGSMILVRAGGDLQAALNSAKCGDTIVLQAGARFQASGDKGFVFPAKSCGDYITVQTSNFGGLPNGRVEISHAAAMPKIVPPSFGGNTYPAMTFPANSKFWQLIGIEATTLPGQPYCTTLVDIGPYAAWDEAPSDLIFDRVYVHSLEDGTNNPEATSRIGFNVFARRLTLKNSRVALPAGYVKGTTTVDNQYAFLCIAGPGPITIDNSFLSAWYNIFFTGGASLPTPNQAAVRPGATLSQATLSNVNNLQVGDLIALQESSSYYGAAKVTAINGKTVSYTPYATSIGPAGGGSPLNAPPISPGDAQWNGYNPQSFTITHNTLYINPVIAQTIFAQTGNYPKGFFEIKAMDGMLMEGNDFQGYPSIWAFTARNQTTPHGAPSVWSTIKNVTLRSNRFWCAIPYPSRAITFQLEDNYATSTPGGNILLENNLLVNVGKVADLAGGDGVTFRHNTFIANLGSSMLESIGSAVQNFVFKDNIAANNEYGVHCAVEGYSCFPGLFNGKMLGNLIVGPAMPYRPTCGNPYPAGNYCVGSMNQVGFADLASRDYRLAPTSRYKGKASDGKDPGVDMDKLMSAIGSWNVAPDNSIK
jgi:hypothetical protein